MAALPSGGCFQQLEVARVVQPAQDILTAYSLGGNPVLKICLAENAPEGPFLVFVEFHEGGEAESGEGNLPDEGLGFGSGFAIGLSNGPLVAEFLGQRAEAIDGEGQGVDAVSDLAQ